MASPPKPKLLKRIPIYVGQAGQSATGDPSNHEMCLLQYPLRPSSRPYEAAKGARVKRKQGRLEIALDEGVGADWKAYDDAESEVHEPLVLRSDQAQLTAGYAVLSVHSDGNAYAVPVKRALAMRPAAAPTKKDVEAAKEAQIAAAERQKRGGGGGNAGASANGGAAASGGGANAEGGQDLEAVNVSVRRRETERQTEARLSSHAHMRARDAQEEWVEIGECAARPRKADDSRIVDTRAKAAPTPKTVTKSQYLAALVPPVKNDSFAELNVGAGGGKGAWASALTPGGGLSRRLLDELPLQERLRQIFAHGKREVMAMANLARNIPSSTKVEELLTCLALEATLVQGCWVGDSQKRMQANAVVSFGHHLPPAEKAKAKKKGALREYALWLFATEGEVTRDRVLKDGVKMEKWRPAIAGIAEQVPSQPYTWRIAGGGDDEFAKARPQVAKEQLAKWKAREAAIVKAAQEANEE